MTAAHSEPDRESVIDGPFGRLLRVSKVLLVLTSELDEQRLLHGLLRP